jgi:hypothetical protein
MRLPERLETLPIIKKVRSFFQVLVLNQRRLKAIRLTVWLDFGIWCLVMAIDSVPFHVVDWRGETKFKNGYYEQTEAYFKHALARLDIDSERRTNVLLKRSTS